MEKEFSWGKIFALWQKIHWEIQKVIKWSSSKMRLYRISSIQFIMPAEVIPVMASRKNVECVSYKKIKTIRDLRLVLLNRDCKRLITLYVIFLFVFWIMCSILRLFIFGTWWALLLLIYYYHFCNWFLLLLKTCFFLTFLKFR